MSYKTNTVKSINFYNVYEHECVGVYICMCERVCMY